MPVFVNVIGFLSDGLSPASAAFQQGGMPVWAWILLIILIILIVLFIWWQWRSSRTTVSAPAKTEERAAAAPERKPKSGADDLAVIEGIGPKISGVLKDAGIVTFADLAAADASKLEQILQDANLRLADPATWPEQAKLAAEGKWDDLEKLQENLKGGRRA